MPIAVDAPTLIVNVDVAVPPEGGVTEVGLKEAVVPVGAPVTVRLTAELKPFRDVTVIVEVPEPPGVTETVVGEALKEKSGAGATVSDMVVV